MQRHPPRRPGQPGVRAVFLLLLLAMLGAAPGGAHAAQRDYYFELIGSKQGLAQNSVHVLYQDPQGLIWMATESGLHRYDGYRLKLYRHDPRNPDGLPAGAIAAVASAPEGQMWVATRTGALVRFAPLANQVTQRVPVPGGSIDSLHTDASGRLWIAQEGSVRILQPPYKQPETVFQLPATDDNRPQSVADFAECPDGRVYAASSGGLLELAPHPGAGGLLGPSIPARAALCDASGHLYIADDLGVAEVDRESGKMRRIWSVGKSETGKPVALAMDQDGFLWLGLRDRGLLRIASNGSGLQLIEPQPGIAHSLPEQNINVLLVDQSGILWVGGSTFGAAHFDPTGAPFRTIINTRADNRLDANNIRAVLVDSKGTYWLGSRGAGLFRYDPDSRSFRNASAPIISALGLPANSSLDVFDLAPAAAGALWVGTDDGAVRFDPASGVAVALKLLPGNQSPPEVRKLLVDRDGSLWLGTLRDGLIHYREGIGVLHRYGIADGLASAVVWDLLRDDQGRLWAATPAGLNLFQPITRSFRAFGFDDSRKDSLNGDSVSDIYQTTDGSILIGTSQGLNRLLSVDEGGAHFEQIALPNPTGDQTVYCILEDAAGNLWLAGNLGITRLSGTGAASRIFTVQDGLQSLEFNIGSCLARDDGTLLFGGIKGLSQTAPTLLEQDSFLPPILITSVEIDAESAVVPAKLEGELEIPAAASMLEFGFVSLDYAAPQHNQFRYRLVGFDKRWVEAGTRHTATYTGLDPGQYRFEVQGSNASGTFNPVPAAFDFVILPPWWATPWARVAEIASLLFVLLLAGLLLMRRRHFAREHQLQLQERDRRLQMALWGSGDQFWDWDVRAGTLHRIGADQVAGGESEQTLDIGFWRDQVVHPEDISRVNALASQHMDGSRPAFESEHRIRTADGNWLWVRSRGKIVERDSEGNPLRLCGTAHDVTKQRLADRDRRIAAEVIRSMAEAVCVTDLEFRFVSVNVAFTRMSGFTEADVLGRDAAIMNARQHSAESYLQVREILQRTGHWSGELWQRRKHGEEFLCSLEMHEVWDANGNRTHYVTVLTDITEKKRIEQELRYLANYDSLTGLPSRSLLTRQVEQAIEQARRTGKRIAMLFLDLDRFKQVNDTLGHTIGDRMLQSAGQLLRASIRDTDTVARFGGDEFAILVEDIEDVAEAERIADNILQAFAMPLSIDAGQELTISTSIGIAIFPDQCHNGEELLKFADTSMYEAKARGRNTWVVYSAEMDAKARRQAALLGALYGALGRKEMSLAFQPKLDISTWRITGVEALLRWNSPEHGLVPPGLFIPLAEEAGLIPDIGRFVLEAACSQLADWRDRGIARISMAVNISSAQLLDSTLASELRAMLARFKLDPERLELELTEGLVMRDARTSVATLDRLKSLGVRVAIDDFGTGYSSLAYLKRLPLDTLKIDKDFIDDLTVDPNDEAITSTIITMAHALGLNVVAEGVETSEQLAYLKEKDCDEIQGNWFAPALDPVSCLDFLQRHDPESRGLSTATDSGL